MAAAEDADGTGWLMGASAGCSPGNRHSGCGLTGGALAPSFPPRRKKNCPKGAFLQRLQVRPTAQSFPFIGEPGRLPALLSKTIMLYKMHFIPPVRMFNQLLR